MGLSVDGAADLTGLRILVVEDNLLVAEQVCGLLAARGCEVVGPAPRRLDGLALIGQGITLDGAVLDVHLGEETCFDIASQLRDLSVPFVFLTGYDDLAVIPAEFRAAPLLSKPVNETRLLRIAAELFGEAT